ncbi:MAG TPA: DUF3293 domain-containing protein [Acidimicrobiales bacterium]|nr:DUF3293 domain-containing protein [Acidimicrobiales bacterium]
MDDPVWDAFRRTNVRLTLPTGTFDIAPTADLAPGEYLRGSPGPIHILTAQNPMGLAASVADNAAANAELAAELTGQTGLTVWPATGYGGGPIDAPDTWQEAGFAVEGLDRRDALELGIRYEQRAIFTWLHEPGGFRLVACDGSSDEPRGWAATLTPRP